jgi:lysophospholipase
MQLYATVQNREPAGSQCQEVLTADGIRLRAITITPEKANKGTVVILNGRSEFVERYFETFNDLTKRGYAVASFDWRGQGGSQRLCKNPMRGYVNTFADYDKDLNAIMKMLEQNQSPKPYYALAHSMGGQLLLRALRDHKYFTRAVMTGPLLGFHYGRWPRWVVPILTFTAKYSGFGWLYIPGSKTTPIIQKSQFTGNVLMTDKTRWDRDIAILEAHPQLAIGGPTYSWLRAAMASMKQLHRWPRKKGPSCPTLIVLAGNDRVVDNRATRNFVAQAPGFSLTVLNGSEHEILNETNDIRQRFWAAFDAFMTPENNSQR